MKYSMEVVLPGYDAKAHLVIAHLQGYGWKDTLLIEARYFCGNIKNCFSKLHHRTTEYGYKSYRLRNDGTGAVDSM